MRELTILSRPDCHLCEVLCRMAQRLEQEHEFTVRKVDVETSDSLRSAYGARVPVLLLDGVEIGSGKLTEGDLRRALKSARWRRSVSRILFRATRWFAHR